MNQQKINQALKRLEKMVTPDIQSLEKLLIVQKKNKYHLFARRYVMENRQGDYHVWRSSTFCGIFRSRRTAISWCVADQYNQWALGQEIKEFDREKFNLENNIISYELNSTRTADAIKSEILKIRLIQDKNRLEYIEQELNKCINRTKYIQTRGFNNEIARTFSKNTI